MTRSKFIGHVHLKVRDLKRAEKFYTELLGFHVSERVGRYLFLTCSDRHHDLALQEIGRDAEVPPDHAVGLYHFAVELEGLDDLAEAYVRLQKAGVDFSPVDHGISQSLYFSDPDGNGIELYVDTRQVRKEWRGISTPIDVDKLLARRKR